MKLKVLVLLLILLLASSLIAASAMAASTNPKDTDKDKGTISGVVFEDHNFNGAKDKGDDGVNGFSVLLYVGVWGAGTSEPQLYAMTETKDGAYVFNDIPKGTYTITIPLPVGYIAATQPWMTTRTVTVGNGRTTANFGVIPNADIP